MEERPEQRYHRPVLLEQTIEALDIRPDGVYLDGTAGGGGHSFAIASRITTGRLIALDRDPDAVKEAGQRLQGLPAAVVQANFTQMAQVLESLGVDGVDGVLLDIGVSSHQLDEAGRGFSYHMEAPLDMRMSQSGVTADVSKRQQVSGIQFGVNLPVHGLSDGFSQHKKSSHPARGAPRLKAMVSFGNTAS